MNDDPFPHDKRLHFGCGLLFGGVITLLLCITSASAVGVVQWMFVAAGAFACGLLAMWRGETFWAKASSIIETVSRWSRH